MKTIKQIICWWKGHDPEPPGYTDGCQRCGKSDLSYNEYCHGGMKDHIWYWWTYDRPRWLKKNRCHDCGKKFNKRNDHSRCIPF